MASRDRAWKHEPRVVPVAFHDAVAARDDLADLADRQLGRQGRHGRGDRRVFAGPVFPQGDNMTCR